MAKGFDFAYGDRVLVRLPLASSSADIEVGDAIRLKAATTYYQDVDTLSDATVGIAVEKVTSPTSDGGATVLVNVSEQARCRSGRGDRRRRHTRRDHEAEVMRHRRHRRCHQRLSEHHRQCSHS